MLLRSVKKKQVVISRHLPECRKRENPFRFAFFRQAAFHFPHERSGNKGKKIGGAKRHGLDDQHVKRVKRKGDDPRCRKISGPVAVVAFRAVAAGELGRRYAGRQ